MSASVAPSWQEALSQGFRSAQELCAEGLIDPQRLRAIEALGSRFSVRVPRYYASLIDRAHPEACPILRQAVPDVGEADPVLPPWAVAWSRRLYGRDSPWQADAIGDVRRQAAPRLTHRYGNRAILHVSAACALTCRYCFRKVHLGGREAALYGGSLQPALRYLHETPEISEAILTGGDPLSLPDAALGRLLEALCAVPHLRQLRIHSRMPVTLPMRITPPLVQLLAAQRLPVSLQTHFNHPRELTSEARLALMRLRQAGIATFNQAVLLRGVNDSVETLAGLLQGLAEAQVAPTYLHHADWTPGTFHFRTSIARGRRLLAALFGRVPGTALPHYVCDLPGGLGKVPLMQPGVRRIARRRDARLQASLWRLPVPATRQKGPAHALYLDVSWRRPSPQDGCPSGASGAPSTDD